jgi:DNA-directed RNA polymerase specialized sigma24 family protein
VPLRAAGPGVVTRLRPFSLTRLPNTGELDDCVSEVFTRALEGIRDGWESRVLEAWLFGIAKNVLKDRYEAKRVAAAGLPDDLPAPPVDSPLELDCPDLPDRISDSEVPATRSQPARHDRPTRIPWRRHQVQRASTDSFPPWPRSTWSTVRHAETADRDEAGRGQES